jgi:hypothetical protein
MDRQAIEIFIGKKVKVEKGNGWFYRGYFSVTQDGIILNDFKIGSIFIAFHDINSMEEWKE